MRKISKIDCIIIGAIYLMIAILGFFGLQRNVNRIIIVAILARLVVRYNKSLVRNKSFIFGVLITFAIIVTSFLMNGSRAFFTYGWGNLLMLLYSMIYTLYFYFLCRDYSNTINAIYSKSSMIINLTMIANMIAVVYQVNHPGQFIAAVNGNNDPDILKRMINMGDTASGFFAFGGVHTLCIFSVFTIIYDLSFFPSIKKKWQKLLIAIYIIIIIILNLSIALLNDNKAFFIVFPVSLLIYFFMGLDLSKNSIKKLFGTITVLLFIVIIGISFNNKLLSTINETLVNIAGFSKLAIRTGMANGSNERIAIPIFAFQKVSTWLFGMGVGIANFYQSGFLGFNHFGQSDLGTFLIFFGIWLSSCIIIYFLRLYSRIIMPANHQKNGFINFCLFFLFILMLIFTQIIANSNNQIAFLLLILALRMRFISAKAEKC